MSFKKTNIVALIIIDSINKIRQSFVFNEADPFDQIAFDLFKIVMNYNDPDLEGAYTTYENKKMEFKKNILHNFIKKYNNKKGEIE